MSEGGDQRSPTGPVQNRSSRPSSQDGMFLGDPHSVGLDEEAAGNVAHHSLPLRENMINSEFYLPTHHSARETFQSSHASTHALHARAPARCHPRGPANTDLILLDS